MIDPHILDAAVSRFTLLRLTCAAIGDDEAAWSAFILRNNYLARVAAEYRQIIRERRQC